MNSIDLRNVFSANDETIQHLIHSATFIQYIQASTRHIATTPQFIVNARGRELVANDVLHESYTVYEPLWYMRSARQCIDTVCLRLHGVSRMNMLLATAKLVLQSWHSGMTLRFKFRVSRR